MSLVVVVVTIVIVVVVVVMNLFLFLFMSLNSIAVYKRNQRVKAQNRMWKFKQRENYFREHYRYTYVTQKKKL